MVCGGCQRHPLFHPKLREKQNNGQILSCEYFAEKGPQIKSYNSCLHLHASQTGKTSHNFIFKVPVKLMCFFGGE